LINPKTIEKSITTARKVGLTGFVLATDILKNILRFASKWPSKQD